jgi:hypothetical protein
LKSNDNPTQDDIYKVTEAYNNLTDSQKSLVTDYDSVIKAAQAKVDVANKKQAANTIQVAKSKAAVKVGVKSAKGNVTVKSSIEKVAKVSYKKGKVVIKGAKKGKATVKVAAAGNGTYSKATKTIKVTVKK